MLNCKYSSRAFAPHLFTRLLSRTIFCFAGLIPPSFVNDGRVLLFLTTKLFSNSRQVWTSVGRVLIKSIPVATGIRPIRSDPTGMVTCMTCALAFWHGWNSIPVQCQTKPIGAHTYARIDTRGYLASPSLRCTASRVSGMTYVY